MENTEQEPEETPTEVPEPEPTETPEPPEVPPEEPEEPEETEPGEETEDGEVEENAEATDAKPDEKHKRQSGYKRRIERLERDREQKDALIQQLISKQQPAAGTPAAKDPAAQMQEYISGQVREQLAREREQDQLARTQSDFQKRMQETHAKHPDFEEALQDVSHIPVPAEFQQVLLTSEQGPAIMYSLAKNPVELARISALPPLQAAREIGRLEAKLASGAAPVKPKPAIRPPVPPTTVGGTAKSTGNLDDMPLAAYKLAMRSRRAK